MSDSKFKFYERVRVTSVNPGLTSINSKLGAVLGKAQGDDGQWSYGVFIYETERVWTCCEDELTATGEFDRRDSFYQDSKS